MDPTAQLPAAPSTTTLSSSDPYNIIPAGLSPLKHRPPAQQHHNLTPGTSTVGAEDSDSARSLPESGGGRHMGPEGAAAAGVQELAATGGWLPGEVGGVTGCAGDNKGSTKDLQPVVVANKHCMGKAGHTRKTFAAPRYQGLI
jgi:hypothetical protein